MDNSIKYATFDKNKAQILFVMINEGRILLYS